MNRDEQNDFCKLRALGGEANCIADEFHKHGRRQFAADLRCAVTKIKKVVTTRLNELDPKEYLAVERSYRKTQVIVAAPDILRTIDVDRPDDIVIQVYTQDLYNFAEFAIEACRMSCDGQRENCKLRDQMIAMRIPPKDEYAIGCPLSRCDRTNRGGWRSVTTSGEMKYLIVSDQRLGGIVKLIFPDNIPAHQLWNETIYALTHGLSLPDYVRVEREKNHG
jgi:hypothetical protein